MFKWNELSSTTAFLRILAATIAVGLFLSMPATASLTSFAQLSSFDGTFAVTDNGTSESLSVLNQQVVFDFENIDGTLPPGLTGSLSASFTMNATSITPGVLNGSAISEAEFSGSFSIIADTPVNGQSNLLSGTFGPNLALSGGVDANNANFAPVTETEVVYSSSFIALTTPIEVFTLSLISIAPDFQLGAGNFIDSFTADETVTFTTDDSPGLVPEPGSIVSMGAGLLGLAWFASRRAAANRR